MFDVVKVFRFSRTFIIQTFIFLYVFGAHTNLHTFTVQFLWILFFFCSSSLCLDLFATLFLLFFRFVYLTLVLLIFYSFSFFFAIETRRNIVKFFFVFSLFFFSSFAYFRFANLSISNNQDFHLVFLRYAFFFASLILSYRSIVMQTVMVFFCLDFSLAAFFLLRFFLFIFFYFSFSRRRSLRQFGISFYFIYRFLLVWLVVSRQFARKSCGSCEYRWIFLRV